MPSMSCLGRGRLRRLAQVGVHEPVHLLQVVRAVAQDDVEQFQHGDLAAVVGRHHPVKPLGVAAVQERDEIVGDAAGVVGNLLRLYWRCARLSRQARISSELMEPRVRLV